MSRSLHALSNPASAAERCGSADLEYRERLHVKLQRELGRDVLQALQCPRTEDILLNPDASLWLHATAAAPRRIGTLSAAQAASAIGTLAALQGRAVHALAPVLETELPFAEARFEGLLPPLVRAPSFAIRCLPRIDRTLEDWARAGILSAPQGVLATGAALDATAAPAEPAPLPAPYPPGPGPNPGPSPSPSPDRVERFRRGLPPRVTQLQVLQAAVRERLNILVVGATGAGKTSLVNVLLATIASETPEDRVVVVEDTAELRCAAPNVCALRLCDGVSMRRALRVALRLKPKRLVVGEVRGAEALTLIKAWGTGHQGGVSTLHAEHALGGLQRLEALALEAPGMRLSAVRPWIAAAVQLVVVIAEERTAPAGRRVQELLVVCGRNDKGDGYALQRVGE